MKFIYTFSIFLALFGPFLGTNAVQQIRSGGGGGSIDGNQARPNLNQPGIPIPEQENRSQEETTEESTREDESTDQESNTTARQEPQANENVKPECIGAILKPLRLEMTKYVSYGLGERVERDQHIISKSSQIGDHFDMFLIIEFELDPTQADYIKLLSPNFEAVLKAKMNVVYNDFGYACPKHVAFVGDADELSEDKYIEPEMTFVDKEIGEDNYFTVSVKDLLVSKVERNKSLMSQSFVDQRNGFFLSFVLKPDAKCVFDISVEDNKPSLEINPLETTYVDKDNWGKCTEDCKSKTAYQCAPIKCFELTEPCKVEKLYKKRPCQDVPECNSWSAWFSYFGMTKLIYFGLAALGLVLILAVIYFFLRRNRNPRYVQIEGGDAAGSIYAGE